MHLSSTDQFKTRESLDAFLEFCDKRSKWSLEYCQDKILANLFFEPSTRTRLSFEVAMKRLGGNVITLSDPKTSSIVKGESLEDTVATISQYVDVIALRHPEVGASERAAKVSSVPVINAGDGEGEHPTQALLDLYTIKSKRTLDNLTVLICGDLRNGRTVHSLVRLLSLYENLRLVVSSPKPLGLPKELRTSLEERNVKIDEVDSVSDGVKEKPNIIYMTRLQKERGSFGIDYEKQHLKTLDGMLDDAIIMHPMPRNNELPTEFDEDRRSVYLRDQPKNGVRVRMGLIYSMLSGKVHYTK